MCYVCSSPRVLTRLQTGAKPQQRPDECYTNSFPSARSKSPLGSEQSLQRTEAGRLHSSRRITQTYLLSYSPSANNQASPDWRQQFAGWKEKTAEGSRQQPLSQPVCAPCMTDDRAPTVPNMCWAPAPAPQHQEWSALASPGAALQQQHQLGCCPPAGALPEVGTSSSLPERPTPSAPTQPPAKNILALVTAADHSSAPVLEFRLQTDDDALLACHRVQAFVFNQARHCPASPAGLRSAFHRILMHGACLAQAVSSQQHLYADSSMCGGRAHLFDLEVLNLTYYGSSVWTVSVVGNLPSGGVSMALLDSLGNCERCNASNVASSRPNANPLGTITVEAAVANGALAWTRLRWQLTAEEVKLVLVKPIAHPAAKPAGKLEVPELASSGSSASSGSFKPTIGLNVGGAKLIPIGPAKARKGGATITVEGTIELAHDKSNPSGWGIVLPECTVLQGAAGGVGGEKPLLRFQPLGGAVGVNCGMKNTPLIGPDKAGTGVATVQNLRIEAVALKGCSAVLGASGGAGFTLRNLNVHVHTIIAGIWVAFFQECQQ